MRKKTHGRAEPAATRHSLLMREMDSTDGAWNPEPDAHIAGMLREDVELSPNETKVVALVKAACIRPKAGGRTAWGSIDGKPLTLARIAEYFGWNSGNASRYVRRPLAAGFIRQDHAGIYGLGARVDGVFDEGEQEANDEKSAVCTDSIPKYINAQTKGLSILDLEKFRTGWVRRKQEAQERFNRAVQEAREAEHRELAEHCRSFGIEMKTNPKVLSVQTASPTVYTGKKLPVRADIYKESEKTIRDQRTPRTTDSTPSSSSSVPVSSALATYGHADDDAAEQLLAECQQQAPEATAEDVAREIHVEARRAIVGRKDVRNPIGLLLRIVPKKFAGEMWRPPKPAAEHKNGRFSAPEDFDPDAALSHSNGRAKGVGAS